MNKRVEQTARTLETACREETPQVPDKDLLDNLTQALEELLTSLKTL